MISGHLHNFERWLATFHQSIDWGGGGNGAMTTWCQYSSAWVCLPGKYVPTEREREGTFLFPGWDFSAQELWAGRLFLQDRPTVFFPFTKLSADLSQTDIYPFPFVSSPFATSNTRDNLQRRTQRSWAIKKKTGQIRSFPAEKNVIPSFKTK